MGIPLSDLLSGKWHREREKESLLFKPRKKTVPRQHTRSPKERRTRRQRHADRLRAIRAL